jgi:hypothetical protein
MTSMHSARWTKLGATTSHVSARKMMSAWTSCRPRGVFIFHALPDRARGAPPPIVLRKSPWEGIKMRNNRIGASGFLNQRCALTPDLESILRARTGKIVLQHNPPESGQIADVSVSPVCANRVITQRGQQHPIRSPRRRGEQRATWNGSPASRWNGTCERWSPNCSPARVPGRCRT